MTEKYMSAKAAWKNISIERPYVSYAMVIDAVRRGEIKAYKTCASRFAKFRLKLSDVKNYYQNIEEQEINF